MEAIFTLLYLDSFITKLFKYLNTKLLFCIQLSIVLSNCTPLLRIFKEKTQFPVMKDKNKQTCVYSCTIAIDILRDDDKKLNTFYSVNEQTTMLFSFRLFLSYFTGVFIPYNNFLRGFITVYSTVIGFFH